MGGSIIEETRGRLTGFIKNSPATSAFQEGLPPLDGEEGNEEKANVMVQPFEPG
jgi:hypothetical protein